MGAMFLGLVLFVVWGVGLISLCGHWRDAPGERDVLTDLIVFALLVLWPLALVVFVVQTWRGKIDDSE